MKDSMSVSIRLSATTVDKIDKVAERVSDTWGVGITRSRIIRKLIEENIDALCKRYM